MKKILVAAKKVSGLFFGCGVVATVPRRLSGKRVLTPFFLIALALAAASAPAAEPAAVPSFRRDVMPVFFRAGCNACTCHGAARRNDAFIRLLFGYDLAGDYRRTVE
jgi:hypothetical protein